MVNSGEDLEARRNRAKYIVGRRAGNDIVVDNPRVSSRHCCITILPENRFEITDLGSANGTFISQRRVTSEIVGPADRISFGGGLEYSVAELLVQLQDPSKREVSQKRGIFLSYRRADTEHIAGRLFDTLSAVYGKEHVFFDTEAIPGAVAFEATIRDALAKSAVVIALIGPNWARPHRSGFLASWLTTSKAADFVEIEIQTAFGLAVPVVPVLVGAAEMPTQKHLAPSIRGITGLNAVKLRSGRDFQADARDLVKAVDQYRRKEP